MGQATGLAWIRVVKRFLLPNYIIYLIIFMIHLLNMGFVYHFPLLGDEIWLVSPWDYSAYKIFCYTFPLHWKYVLNPEPHWNFLWPSPYVSFGGALWSPEMFLYLIEIKSGFHFTFLKCIEQVHFLFKFLRGRIPALCVPRIQTEPCQNIPVVFHRADQCVHEILVVACVFCG